MCLCFLNANRNWSVQATPKLHLFWKGNHLLGYEWRRSVEKREMKIVLLPQRSVRKTGAQFLMREVILKLCLKKVPMWCNTCGLILSKAVRWCSLGTPALHLQKKLASLKLECGVVTTLLLMTHDENWFCGAAEDLRHLCSLRPGWLHWGY